MTYFTFALSVPALGKTALAFAAIFLLVMVYHAFAVSRSRLIDLLQAGRVNQALRRGAWGASVALFLLGAALLAVAYAMLLTRGLLAGGRPVLGDDRPGQPGHPALFPLPVRLPAADLPEQEGLLPEEPEPVRAAAVQTPASTPPTAP